MHLLQPSVFSVIQSQNSKITAVKQSFRDGCDTIVSGCTSYGNTPASNSPADIVTSIGTIYTNRYNSGRTQGRNDVKNNPSSYGLYVPPTRLTGSYTTGAGNNESEGLTKRQINFSPAFKATPTVTVSCSHNRGVAKVVSVNRSTLVIGTAKSGGDPISSMTVNWTAYTN